MWDSYEKWYDCGTYFFGGAQSIFRANGSFFGIDLLKTRHNVKKLDLIVPLLSILCIDIDLSIQHISLTLYVTWVHKELDKGYKS